MSFYNECNSCLKHSITLKCNCSWKSCITCWNLWFLLKGDKVKCPHCQTDNFPLFINILFLIKSYYLTLLNIKNIIYQIIHFILYICFINYIIGEIVNTILYKYDKSNYGTTN